jgi:cytidylate kinase
MPRSIESIIDRQLRRWEHERRIAAAGGVATRAQIAAQPIITVSRQHGSRGRDLASRLAERFQYTLLHRDVIDRISLCTGHLRRLLESLDEHSRSQLTMWADSMISGRYLDETDYAVGLLKTVQSMARLGGVVVVGRGANFIVESNGGVHLRVVAPLEERVQNLMRRGNVSAEEAAHEIKTVDEERAKFVRKLFHRSVDDPLGYDMIVNESGRSLDDLVKIATVVVEEKLARLKALQA